MFKKFVCLFTSICLIFCLFVPPVFADEPDCLTNGHSFSDPPGIMKGFDGEIQGFPVKVSIKYCSKCKFYFHECNVLGIKLEYMSLTGFTGIDGELQAFLFTQIGRIMGSNASASQFQAGGGSASPGGVGRHPSGYVDENGTPSITQTGILHLSVEPMGLGWGIDRVIGFTETNTFKYMQNGMSGEGAERPTDGSTSLYYAGPIYKIVAPVNGIYRVNNTLSPNTHFKFWQWKTYSGGFWSEDDYNVFEIASKTSHYVTLKAGQEWYFRFDYGAMSAPYKYQLYNLDLYIEPIADANIVKNATITINNNTWNGNIYVDNTNKLTYIYPQYTTVNESNETVTNISNNPIIYNEETKQYYTYDQTTNNYYYITYGDPAPTPTPSPSPDPGGSGGSDNPSGGGSSGGGSSGGGSSGGSSGSGSSWWGKLLDKLGSALIDGLLDAIKGILKLLFDLISSILGWIIWLCSKVFDLFPFLPPGVGALLVGGVVVCFILAFIKFIRG